MATKGESTKGKIVQTAQRLFRKQGYGKTSIDDICRESGVKRGNLYFYFKSKEEVAQAAIEYAVSIHVPFFETLIADETDPLRKIELMIDGIVAYYVARGCSAG
ncbi:MAG: TetR/AcrR family transcriptional regulator [Desulfomonile tiedjei]|nr:TetR/AcrR family transcriptional regulator [Desulfomonile tiedjei]